MELNTRNTSAMKHLLRPLNLVFTALLALAASAQYTVVVVGQLSPCAPANAGGTVTVMTTSFLEPPQTLTTLLDANCNFLFNMTLSNPSGGLFIATSCGDGTMATDSVVYNLGSNPMDSLFITMTCGGSSPCNADFTVQQAMGGGMMIPWQITTTNQSTGDGILSYQWWMPDGSASTEAEPTWTFNAPGVYGICLTLTSVNGTDSCSSWMCDTVMVDTNGFISTAPIWYDCEGVLWGPAVAGTPCDDGDPMTTGEIWTSDCSCTADSMNTGCEAGFWAIQAYDSVPGGVAPIPNEVWVWNLSSGGNGTYQFFWDFGDGTSSTEAYPTHVYSGNGPWLLCLTMVSDSCTDTYCDSISVDEDGFLNGLVIDGHGVPNSTDRSEGFTLNVISEIPTGINELNADSELRLWPNPVDNALNVAFRSLGGSGMLSIIDGNGRTVKAITERFTSGTNRLTVPVDELAPGLYLMRLSNGNNSSSARFLKTR